MDKNTGGAAFPIPIITAGSINDSEYALNALKAALEDAQGMTLRDYFASHANEQDIQDMLSILMLTNTSANRRTARWAHADAMLKARGEQG